MPEIGSTLNAAAGFTGTAEDWGKQCAYYAYNNYDYQKFNKSEGFFHILSEFNGIIFLTLRVRIEPI